MKLSICCVALCLAVTTFGQDLETAEKLFWDKDYKEAERVLRDLLAKEPGDPDVRYQLAMTLLETKRPDEAEKQISAARNVELIEDKLRIAEGRLALERKRNPEALKLFSEAVKVEPENFAAYYYRGLVYATTGDFQRSADDFEKSIELHPENYLAHYYAGIANNRIRHPDKMVTHFEQLIKLAPKSEEAKKAQSLLRSVR